MRAIHKAKAIEALDNSPFIFCETIGLPDHCSSQDLARFGRSATSLWMFRGPQADMANLSPTTRGGLSQTWGSSKELLEPQIFQLWEHHLQFRPSWKHHEKSYCNWPYLDKSRLMPHTLYILALPHTVHTATSGALLLCSLSLQPCKLTDLDLYFAPINPGLNMSTELTGAPVQRESWCHGMDHVVHELDCLCLDPADISCSIHINPYQSISYQYHVNIIPYTSIYHIICHIIYHTLPYHTIPHWSYHIISIISYYIP